MTIATPHFAGLKLDTLSSLLAPLPKEVRKPTEQAIHLLQTLQSERVLMAMPPGIVEK